MPANSQSASQVYMSEVEQSDIYLALLGSHYGYEDENGISPTECEYGLATKLHKDRLIFIKRMDKTQREEKEAKLIAKAEQCVVRKSFNSYEELRTAVYASLVRYLEENEYLRLLPFDATLNPNATLDDIDPELIDIFVEKARKKRAFPLSKDSGIERVLKSLNLIDNGRLTNAALLLFGKEPQKFFPTSEVKCVQFYTTTISKPLASYQVFRGSVFEMIDNAVSFVMSHIDARVGAREIQAETDVNFELPLKSVTESIVNACCHRNYTSNGSVQIMLFPDRLEVWNPGRLPFGLTTEQLSLPHTSIPNNPVLANPLYLAGYVERLGTGTSDMVDECISLGLKAPEFILDSNFCTILWRKNAPSPLENAPSSLENALSSSIKLNKKQKMVLEYCRTYSKSSNEIFQHLGIVNQSRAREKYITQLILAGLLRPIKIKSNDPDQKYITTESSMPTE